MGRAVQLWNRYSLPIQGAALLAALYLISRRNFLLFHSIAEFFSIVVGFSIFLFAWNSRRFFQSSYFLFLGVAFLVVAALDFMHTLGYPGMTIFAQDGSYIGTHFWLAARFVQGAALLIAPWFVQRQLRAGLALLVFGGAGVAWTVLIFRHALPIVFIDGQGLTEFKLGSEYLIVLILLGAAVTHWRARQAFQPVILAMVLGSIALTIVSELVFTLYQTSQSGISLIGHFLKIAAFYLIYRAVLQTGLVRPFDLLFSDLQRAQERYRAYFRNTLNAVALFEIDRTSRPVNYALAEANQAFARMLELNLDRSIGERLVDLAPDLDGAALRALFQVVETTRQPQRAEHLSPDGQRVFRLSAFAPGPGQMALMMEDITQRKRTETILLESETRLRTVLENMPVLLFAIDETGRIIAWNRECERVTGYSREEVLDHPAALDMLVPEAQSRERLVAASGGKSQSYRGWEVTLVCKDGSARQIAWSSVAEHFPVPGWMDWAVGVDITERKRSEAAEREQRQLAEALRDVANALGSPLSLSEVLDRVLANLERVIPHDVSKVLMIDPETGEAHVVRSRSADPVLQAGLDKLVLPVMTTLHLKQMMHTRQPLIVDDIQLETGMRLTHNRHWRAYLGAPIRLDNQIIGFIGLGSTQPDFFNVAHASRLEAFAGQVAIAIHNARLLERERTLIAAQERERLARDLHDAVSQTLFSASVIAEALPRQWQRDPEKALAQLAELHHLTRGAMAEMRVLLLELRPTSLLEVELPVLLRQLAEAIRSRKRMAIGIEIDGDFGLEPEVKLALYRITQEALNNIAKHSNARKANVRLVCTEQRIDLTIEDNGTGFDQDEVRPTSLGLHIMRERAEEIGAELTITSRLDEGTCLHLILARPSSRSDPQLRPAAIG